MSGAAQPEVVAFMRLIMDTLGTPTTTALQERLHAEDVIPFTELRKVAKWVEGKHAPNHTATIALLRAAQMLRPEADDLLRAAAAQAERAERDARRLDVAKPPQGERESA